MTAWWRADGERGAFAATVHTAARRVHAVEVVEPIAVEPVGNLLDAHMGAGIELKGLPSLWPLHDLIGSDRWGQQCALGQHPARP